MVAINGSLASDVEEFLENGDLAFLTHLRMGPRDDIESQAVVRYLMQLKRWSFTGDEGFTEALDHLFAEYPDRAKRDPAEYQATTFALIKNTFDYECVVVVAEPRPEPVEKAKPAARKASTRKVISSDTRESAPQSDIDTDGASDRLKKVIAIQRAG